MPIGRVGLIQWRQSAARTLISGQPSSTDSIHVGWTVVSQSPTRSRTDWSTSEWNCQHGTQSLKGRPLITSTRHPLTNRASPGVGSSMCPTKSRRHATLRHSGHPWTRTGEIWRCHRVVPWRGCHFLPCFPTSYATRIDSELFRTLLLRRLRLPLPLHTRACRCGRLLDSLGHPSVCVRCLRGSGPERFCGGSGCGTHLPRGRGQGFDQRHGP